MGWLCAEHNAVNCSNCDYAAYCSERVFNGIWVICELSDEADRQRVSLKLEETYGNEKAHEMLEALQKPLLEVHSQAQ